MATLTSEIEKKKKEIEEEYESRKSELRDVSALEEELRELETKLEIARNVSSMSINDSLFQRIFKRKEYKEEVERVTKAGEEVGILEGRICSLKLKIKHTNEDLATIEEERAEALARIEKAKDPVEFCIKENKELLKDLEFLKSCIDYDLRNIVLSAELDEREHDELFAHFSRCYKHIHFDEEELRKMGYDEETIETKRGAIDFIVSELENPKPVDCGQYKIPHRYLRDTIMNQYASFDPSVVDKSFSCLGDVVNGATKHLMEFDFFEYIAERYARFDGTVGEEYGKALEEICDDPDCYVYMHYVDYKGGLDTNIVPTCESICEKGLRLPLAGNEFGNPAYTTLNTNNDRYMTALDFMVYWELNSGIVVLKVPKDVVDNGEPYIGWSYNVGEGYEIEETYMLPEYVVGYTIDGKFVKNPIPLEQRTTVGIERFHKLTTDAQRTDIDSHRTLK